MDFAIHLFISDRNNINTFFDLQIATNFVDLDFGNELKFLNVFSIFQREDGSFVVGSDFMVIYSTYLILFTIIRTSALYVFSESIHQRLN